MPIYEYRCPTCGKTKELLQRHRDAAPKCKTCSVDMKRSVSRTSFILNGTGWYKDGYSSPPNGS